jgi:hypothetical protein
MRLTAVPLSFALLICVPSFADVHEAESAMRVFDQCYLERLDRLKGVCEPADLLATAIANGCETQLRHFESASIRSVGLERGRALAKKLVETRTRQALTTIIELRAEKPCN